MLLFPIVILHSLCKILPAVGTVCVIMCQHVPASHFISPQYNTAQACLSFPVCARSIMSVHTIF